jgi:hypothetical protein
MSGEALAVLAILLGGYPLLVLLVAITGPHNETEKRERAERRAASRLPLDAESTHADPR